jgi:hypothetical protein
MKKILYIAGVVAFLSTGMFQGAWGAESAGHVKKNCSVTLAPLVRKINQFVAHRQLLIARKKELEKMVRSVEDKAALLTAQNVALEENLDNLETLFEKTLVDMLVCKKTMQLIEVKIPALKPAYQEILARFATLDTQTQSIENLVQGLETRYTDYQAFFDHVRVEQDRLEGLNGPHLLFTGANVHIRSGWGYTEDNDTGLGNLIIGYNENTGGNRRTGSHNLVIGPEHSYSAYGGFVAGLGNTVSGPYASVSGGTANTAAGPASSVSAGERNTAAGLASSISGGLETQVLDDYSYGP